jgi:hypothetical protein
MKEKVLAVRGVGGYRQYRIPAMAVTPSGRIIAIYDARFDFDDLPSPIDLVIRISDDNGETWSEQTIFRQHEGVMVMQASLLIHIMANKEELLFFINSHNMPDSLRALLEQISMTH